MLDRIKPAVSTALVFAAAACNPEQSNAPSAGADGVATPAFVTSATAPGVPVGDFHLPVSEFGNPRYTGSYQALTRSNATSRLDAARNRASRVIVSLAGGRTLYQNADGSFNLAKWKARIDLFRGYDFAKYVSAGTVIGHYLVDEAACAKCWGGKTLTYSQIEEMSRYSKSIWPTLPTGVRAPPSLLGSTKFVSLDFGWAQWEGPLWSPSYGLTPEQFRDRETSRAKALGLGLVFGLNYFNGGDRSSGIPGTVSGKYQMSSSEVRRVGKVLAAASYGCAMLSWKYDLTFVGRSGMKTALDEVAAAGRNRSRVSCRQ